MDLVVRSKVKNRIRENGCNMSFKSEARLDELLAIIIDDACRRAKANGRKTVMQQDI